MVKIFDDFDSVSYNFNLIFFNISFFRYNS